jgi:hypothetical protein
MRKFGSLFRYFLAGISIVTGLIAYFVPAGIFISRGDALLGFFQLFFPPAAIVLPWLISPQLGFIALASVVLFPLGVILMCVNKP